MESFMKQELEKKKKFNFRYKRDNYDKLIQVVNLNKHENTEYDYFIARPSIFGNIYSHNPKSNAEHIVGSRNEAVQLYEKYFYSKLSEPDFKKAINELLEIFNREGKLNLVCHCKPKKCHGDIIKEYLIKKLRNET